jgi:hypothetical protein
MQQSMREKWRSPNSGIACLSNGIHVAADFEHIPDRSLGAVTVCGGFLVLIMAVLPLPIPLLTVAVSLGVCALSVIALKRGAIYGGTTAAFGLVGTALAVIALMIAGTFVLTAPETTSESIDTATGAEEVVPVEPAVEQTVEATAEPTVEATAERVVERLPVASVIASSTADDAADAAGNTVSFIATNVADADPATAWRTPGTGKGKSLTFQFSQPVHLVSIDVIPGYAKVDPTSGEDRFAENRRVKEARFEFDNGIVNDFSFRDSPDVQSNIVSVKTTSVQVTILESTGKTRRDFTAISEIEFYGWMVN